MLFRDRRHAGILLANHLQVYRGDHQAVILALPRGGVVVGHEVSMALHLPLDVFITRKIAAPESPEYAVGAISETGAVYLNREAVRAMQLSQEDLDGLIAAQRREIERRRALYREGRGLPHLHHRTVILVDDGIATGATLFATLEALAALNPLRVVVAMPVAPPSTAARIRALVETCVILSTPEPFEAVGCFFEEFDQVTDDEVIRTLHQANEAFQGDRPTRRTPSAIPTTRSV
ncbi:phosphoribosyltransferase [Nitrospira lenta]|uniref:Putative Phosphoribosyltransferase n=1 Tax=Nitrospira lenta TaxID=1436998 RepID=A0A330L044_9BACT|nr:phosphoribosyltransferase family protein [Nitrospira lenta]SPP63128.1 putative Phosphoribosyltransferase [Nitrospira lenta]